jgi:hypothetical protein
LIVTENTQHALRVANPRAAIRPAGGLPPKGRIIKTLNGLLITIIQRLPNHGIPHKLWYLGVVIYAALVVFAILFNAFYDGYPVSDWHYGSQQR